MLLAFHWRQDIWELGKFSGFHGFGNSITGLSPIEDPLVLNAGAECYTQANRKNVGHIQSTNAHDPFHRPMVLEKAHILT